MNFSIEGNLILKENEVNISQSFKKREFVIEVPNERNSDWNDFIKFQLTQDKCSLIDAIEVGEPLKVHFNIRGRKWEKDGKVNYFSNLEAWRIEKGGSGNDAPNDFGNVPPPQMDDMPTDEENDLPF